MPIILIPSRKIYSIENSKILDNNISLVEQSLNNIMENEGNILSKEYTFYFNEYKNGKYEEIFSNTDNTEGFIFKKHTTDTENYVKSNITLSIGQNANVETGYDEDGNLVLTSHRLVTKFRYGLNGTDMIESIETSTADNPPKIVSSNENSIELYVDYYISSSALMSPTLLSATITVVGQFITTGEQKTQTTGSGNKIFSLPTNELVQETNNDISIVPETTLNEYKDGKETAKIICSIGEYYDLDGNKIISTESADKMSFNLHDEVLPMYNTIYGDSPLSFKNSRPKTFKVLGTKAYFDGAVWQELTLQEKGVSNNYTSGSRGLTYLQREQGIYCDGIGSCTDNNIIIGNFYQSKKVFGVDIQAFFGLDNIISITIMDGLQHINSTAFGRCYNLKKVIMPNSITEISMAAFADCQKLETISLSENLVAISNNTFWGCYGLKYIVIPHSVTSIGDYAFVGCSSLTSLTIPNSVITVGEMAFHSCKSLKSIIIGNGVQSIGSEAFISCVNLEDVYYKGTEDQWNAINIGSGNSALLNATIHFNS